jgi:hypothetical protein
VGVLIRLMEAAAAELYHISTLSPPLGSCSQHCLLTKQLALVAAQDITFASCGFRLHFRIKVIQVYCNWEGAGLLRRLELKIVHTVEPLVLNL